MAKLGKRKRKPVLECRFFKTKTGREPVREWLHGLDDEITTKIGTQIERVQWRWPVSKPLVDGFGDGLYEVRVSHDDNIYRVLFCIRAGTMVLLHGLHKKTQNTPAGAVETARKRQKLVEAEA